MPRPVTTASRTRTRLRWRYLVPLLGWLAVGVGLQLLSCEQGARHLSPEPLSEWAALDSNTRYVGQQACQSCHAEIYDSYTQTGMGRSWYRPRWEEIIEDFGAQARVYDAPSNYWYRPYWQDSTLFIQEYRLAGGDTVHSLHERIDYIVGSGHQTRSYILDRNGYLYEAPITWYSQRRKWDMSPGYEGGNNSRFSRAIGAECMHCHNDHSPLVSGTLNKYERVALGIGCERCHGPGSVHVARMEADLLVDVGKMADKSIVNPARLSQAKQFDVCQQCHLQGINVHTGQDFRPAMPLAQAWDVFLVPQADISSFGIASHAARLQQSRCYTQSRSLTCTSCHDPHQGVHGAPKDHYKLACQSCHAPKSGTALCTAPLAARQAQNDNCAHCHMPKGGTSDIPHVSFSDHYIRVVSQDPAPAPTDKAAAQQQAALLSLLCVTTPQPSKDILGRAWLLYYEQHDTTHDARYLAQAAQNLAPDSWLYRARLAYYQVDYPQAEKMAERAQQQSSASDHWPRYWLAASLEAQGKYPEAVQVYKSLHADFPHMAHAAMKAATLQLLDGQPRPAQIADAKTLLLQAHAEMPHDKQVLANLGFLLLATGELADAQRHLHLAVRLDPDYTKALENLVLCYHMQGKRSLRDDYARQLAKLPDGAAALSRLSRWLDN